MPRLRAYARQYADADFKKEVYRCLTERYENVSVRALSRETGISNSTLNNKIRKNVSNLDVSELQQIVAVLNPDPGVILKLLGYSTAQIKKYKEN